LKLQEHIVSLHYGLRDFIEANDRRKLELFINTIKEELNVDSNGITQIHLALFLFRDAVNNALRSHNIKPHWMFALDSLITSAIQTAIQILSPGKINS